MYRSGLLPRRMAMLGLIGGPMLIASFVMILFGVYENGSGPAFLMALPEIVWEASLGIYAAWKGFRPCPITKQWISESLRPSPAWRWPNDEFARRQHRRRSFPRASRSVTGRPRFR
jgi:hypothetical protein